MNTIMNLFNFGGNPTPLSAPPPVYTHTNTPKLQKEQKTRIKSGGLICQVKSPETIDQYQSSKKKTIKETINIFEKNLDDLDSPDNFNDENIINAFLFYSWSKLDSYSLKNRIFIYPSFQMVQNEKDRETITFRGHENSMHHKLSSLLRDKEIILFPFNKGSNHWILICIFRKKEQTEEKWYITYIDSLGDTGFAKTNLWKNIVNTLQEKSGGIGFEFVESNVPNQDKLTCALHVMKNGYRLMNVNYFNGNLEFLKDDNGFNIEDTRKQARMMIYSLSYGGIELSESTESRSSESRSSESSSYIGEFEDVIKKKDEENWLNYILDDSRTLEELGKYWDTNSGNFSDELKYTFFQRYESEIARLSEKSGPTQFEEIEYEDLPTGQSGPTYSGPTYSDPTQSFVDPFSDL